MRFVNLTPHDVAVRDHDDVLRTYPPSGTVARLDESVVDEPVPDFRHRRVVMRLGVTNGLPGSQADVTYIVSMPFAMALMTAGSSRTDVVYPYDMERDAAGRIVAARALARLAGIATGWDEHGHARPTGLPVDRHLGRGDLQDAENCGYSPAPVLARLDVDRSHGDPQVQFRHGRIVLTDGTMLERGGALNCVWAVTRLPAGL